MFNSNLYNISILLLPLNLRKEKVIAWLKVYVSLIKIMMDNFAIYREEKLFFIAHNSQVIYLEHILNHRFNPNQNTQDPNYVGNGIYIDDGQSSDEVYIYNTSEAASDTFLHNSSETSFTEVYLYNASQTQSYVGFIINVPNSFNVNENELKALVNRLKLAGKLYTIKYYTI